LKELDLKMVHRFRLAALIVMGAGALAGLGVQGQQQKLTVNADKSEVHFTLVDKLHTVHGTFHVQQGAVNFSPATGEAAGSIVVDALSGASGNSSRDGRMKKEELNAESFKTITFAPARFTGKFNASGDSALTVHGLFTLAGVGHEIDVPMQVQVNGSQLHATGTFKVPFVSWGLKDPSNFLIKVEKEVQVDLLLVGMLQ
jgi:hypothetical protein